MSAAHHSGQNAGAVLQVEQLVKRFGGLLATDHVSLTLEPGELHAIIGPNGAGKSTLIGQIGGEITPLSGRVLLASEDITHLGPAARALRGLARSYQITSVFPEFSVLENVLLALQAHDGHSFGIWSPLLGERALVDAAQAAIEQVGLAARAGSRVADLAHGERRQLELAMVLAPAPKLLLLDEPTAGMSQTESAMVTSLLRGLKGRFTILLVEHDMDVVFSLADRISVLVYGRIVASGTPDQISGNPQVREAYLGDEEVAL